jgi:hypothetical protein
MYWASGIAKALVIIPPDYSEFNPIEEFSGSGQEQSRETIALDNTDALQTIIRLRRNKIGNLFVTLTKNSVQLWSVRVCRLRPYSYLPCGKSLVKFISNLYKKINKL